MSTGEDEPLHRRLGLTDDEHARIVETLGREPNRTELAMYSVMWSEHCSYKSSKRHLRTLPTEGSAVLVGPGQDAGAIDVGDGTAVVFKIESHSHPSAIEPYQGAATGIGGIVRDIISMGARPIALLDPLYFGPLTEYRNRWLLEGVVAGIGGYGNCIGVPTVGGEVRFAEPHSLNPTINVMCVGIAPAERLVTSSRQVHEGSIMVLFGTPMLSVASHAQRGRSPVCSSRCRISPTSESTLSTAAAPASRRICSLYCKTEGWSSSKSRVASGHFRRNARVSSPAARMTIWRIPCSSAMRCRNSSKNRVRMTIGTVLKIFPARCASQSAPTCPARAFAHGSSNSRSSRSLSIARALAVQYAVDLVIEVVGVAPLEFVLAK